MIKKDNNLDMFYYQNTPSIDLHGEDRKSAEVLVKQFIDDHWKLKDNKIIIVHGRGTGILKKHVHEMLKKDKRVEKIYINFFNEGCTIVELKENI